MIHIRPFLGAIALTLQVASLSALAQQLDHRRLIEVSTPGVPGLSVEQPAALGMPLGAAQQGVPQRQVRFGAYPVLPATAHVGSAVRRWGEAPNVAFAPVHRPPWSLLVLASRYTPGVSLPEQLTPELGWGLTLRVQDPLAQGYTLNVDTRMRGILAADSSALGFASTDLPALRFGVHEAFAPTPTLLPGLTTAEHYAGSTGQLDRTDVNGRGGVRVGHYSGTRDFLFFLQDTPLAMTAVSSLAEASTAWQQFGRATDIASLAFANPLQTDPDMQDLGHFLRVTATFNAVPVPEPGTWAQLAAGLGLLWRRRR